LNAGGVGAIHSSERTAGYRSMTAAVQTTTATVDGAVYRTAPYISESMFITTSMVRHNKEKRTEQNLIVRSRKSEVELALYVLY